MKIAPCPNPKCGSDMAMHRHQPVRVKWDRTHAFIECPICALQGPNSAGKDSYDAMAAAIAAWNSISMGWINANDRQPPKDGKFFGYDGFNAAECEWSFTHSDGEWYVETREQTRFNVLFWMPIPPAPEDK